MELPAPIIINGLLHIPAPVPRIPFCLVLELKGAMQRDFYEGGRHTTDIDRAVKTIVAAMGTDDEPLCRFLDSLECTPGGGDSHEASFDYLPPLIAARLKASRRSNRGRRPKTPERLMLIVTTAIAQWLAATGRLPTLMERDIYEDPHLRVHAPLYHSLRAMLEHAKPEYVPLLTPSVFLSAVRRAPKGVEYVLVPSRPLAKRRSGRPRKS